jgi:hypothetical protein
MIADGFRGSIDEMRCDVMWVVYKEVPTNHGGGLRGGLTGVRDFITHLRCLVIVIVTGRHMCVIDGRTAMELFELFEPGDGSGSGSAIATVTAGPGRRTTR